MRVSGQIFLIFCLLGLSFGGYAQNTVNSIRVWSAPSSTRVVFDMVDLPKYRYFTLSNPQRLVIDFKGTTSQLQLSKIAYNSDSIKKLRLSRPARSGEYRVVLELTKPVKAQVFTLAPTEPYGHRLVVDLEKLQPQVSVSPKVAVRKVMIAIDAGHGGEDPGSIGAKGTQEKKVVLQIATKLQQLINKTKGMQAVMIRQGDYYVGLNQRSEKARHLKADVLLSIHADSVFSRQPKGASVWVLSTRRANTEVGRWLEKTEKHSDLLGGAGEIIDKSHNERYLARTLLDMSMDHSRSVSHALASEVARALGKVTTMHKSKPASASFAVLKSPDIPSILIETGFISNKEEEMLLRQQRHQWKLVRAIKQALMRYFSHHPAPETYYAHLKTKKLIQHKVRSGESISVIAAEYGVSQHQLRVVNQLTNDRLKIGQVLVIPRA
jgi:N-acetylmuramoyl-L-alanine amidase